jgi:hypothetical protein
VVNTVDISFETKAEEMAIMLISSQADEPDESARHHVP